MALPDRVLSEKQYKQALKRYLLRFHLILLGFFLACIGIAIVMIFRYTGIFLLMLLGLLVLGWLIFRERKKH